MIAFDAAHRAVHHPPDRRFRIWIQPSILIGAACAIRALIAAAWIEVAVAGMPAVPAIPQIYPNDFAGPHGFPAWVRYCHFFNFLFVAILIRSGLSILMDHPRLYFNDGCTPGSEWIRFTPLKVPRDRIWTAKDDARYISPLVGTPGYRHTIGLARVWHFIDVHGFIATGIVFIAMLFTTEHWKRIVPSSPLVLLQAWNTFVHYATFHLPPEPNGFYGYNALQQIAYFTVVFVFGPLAIATGIAMSPAVVNRFPWYARIFGGRQSARSIHFLTMFSFLAFLVVHVALIVMTGFTRNMNHIVMGADDQKPIGMYLGFVGIGVVVLSWIVAHYISWRHPRGVQHALKSVTYPMQLLTLNRLLPQQRYTEEEISPYFWPNGKMPLRDDWKHMAESGFDCFRLIWRSLAISHPFQYRYARDRTLRIRSGPKILTFRFADKSGLGSFGEHYGVTIQPERSGARCSIGRADDNFRMRRHPGAIRFPDRVHLLNHSDGAFSGRQIRTLRANCAHRPRRNGRSMESPRHPPRPHRRDEILAAEIQRAL